MGELPFWQLFAASIAVVFVLIGVVALIRLTGLPMLILVASFLAIPTLALALFAVNPRPVQDLSVVDVAFPFVGLAFAAIAGNFVLRIQAGSSPTFASLHRGLPLYLVAWFSLVAAVSVFVYLFEPELAIANVAATAAWFAIWAPRAMRRSQRETTYEIAAPRERVYAFITDPANWPRCSSHGGR